MKKVLVTGATGKQGGAVAKAMLRGGCDVRALTRNSSSASARQLASLGAEIMVGSLDDVESVRKAVKGVDGVFSVQNYWEPTTGYNGEIRQAMNLAEAARDADVGHFIQSTMATADNFVGVRHFQSKRQVEQHLDAMRIRHSLLGTVYFMENLLDPKMGGKMTFPTLSGTLRKNTALHLLSSEDIGLAVREIFFAPDRFLGQRVNLAGDQLTVPEMKSIYRDVTGKSPKWFSVPAFCLRFLAKEFADQLAWHNRTNFQFSVADSRVLFPHLQSFEAFLQAHRNELAGL
jgi:uncharacterized protein YbjT (DUF2867 family)